MTFRISVLVLLWFLSSCESLIDVNPKGALTGATIYDDDKTAGQVLTGIYVKMVEAGFASGGSQGMNVLGGLSADELMHHNAELQDFQANALYPSHPLVKAALWEPAYKFIYYANALLQGLEHSTAISSAVRKQLEGEARFLRAFSFFYLTNLFGDVPLILGTDFRINQVFKRTPQSEVYEQIVADLRLAQELLPHDYALYGDKRIRPNRAAASALLARVFLYLKDWSGAETEATEVITNTALYGLVADLDEVFLANSREAVWQLGPVIPGINTHEGNVFILTGFPGVVSLQGSTVNACEEGDLRALHWISHIDLGGMRYYYPYKYKKRDHPEGEEITEYSMVLRLAELYLIRAEARTRQDKLEGAIADIDAIRQRAGLPLLQDTNPSITKSGLMQRIENERRIELMAEWGHRWLDLKRTGRVHEVLPGVKPGWQATDVLYPIPQSEMDANPNLKPQNPGY